MTASVGLATSVQGIVVQGLHKSYGEKLVLDGIDLEVPKGSVFALLGPNGSGKTTTVQILSTLITADGGNAWVGGHAVGQDPAGVRSVIGVTGQFSAVDNLLTAAENMMLISDLHHLPRAEGRKRVAELLERFDLTDVANKRASTFSGGMRRKLDLAMTLVGKPDIIFLDEPTTGLDPRSRRNLWEIIRDLVADGVTIFLTTQYLEEADHLADRIALLDRAKIVATGTADELKRRIPGGHLLLKFADRTKFDNAVAALPRATAAEDTLTLQIPSDGSITDLRTVLGRLEDTGIDVESLTVHTPDLDDVFLALTGNRTAAAAASDDKDKKGA